MMTARKGLPGHVVYNRVRNANEFLLVLPKEQPQDKKELQEWLIEYHAGKDWKQGEEKNGDKVERGDPNWWDVSKIEDMSELFKHDALKDFNEDIGGWDVSKVKNMKSMFCKATAFNQPIENWDVSKVENMEWMFFGAEAFNQPIEKWDVSKVKAVESMFYKAIAFNQTLPGGWKLKDLKKTETGGFGVSSSAAAGGFSFGSSSVAVSPAGGFSFGGAASPAGGFSFGSDVSPAAPAAPPAPPAPPALPASGFEMSSTSSASSSGFNFGGASFGQTSPSFGQEDAIVLQPAIGGGGGGGDANAKQDDAAAGHGFKF